MINFMKKVVIFLSTLSFEIQCVAFCQIVLNIWRFSDIWQTFPQLNPLVENVSISLLFVLFYADVMLCVKQLDRTEDSV